MRRLATFSLVLLLGLMAVVAVAVVSKRRDQVRKPPPGSLAAVPAGEAAATRSVVVGYVPDPVVEASGLAASSQNPGVVWTHNDSGGAPVIYALGRKARMRAALPLAGAVNRDWEDMAVAPGAPGAPDWLYVADIGDNNGAWPSVRVYRVPEPMLAGVAPGSILAAVQPGSVELAYPGGPRNAEALVVDPNGGDLYVITKDDSRAEVYRARRPAFLGESVTLVLQGRLPFGGVTGASACASGRTVLVRRYFGLDAFVGPSVAQALKARPSPRLVRGEPQGEAVAASPGCEGYFTLSEGVRQPLIRYLR